MSHTGGPSAYLPGQRIKFPAGTVCDNHPTALCAARVVGEVDSFGFEAADLCITCLDQATNASRTEAICDLCPTVTVLRPTRDPEEGTSGRLYYCCPACSKKLKSDFLDGVTEQSKHEHAYED